MGEVALEATALGKSAVYEYWKGTGQFGLGATLPTTEGLKRLVQSERPNRRDDRSFPSGHTSISFSAAGYLHARYGWEWGAPALVAAGRVSWTHVEAREHRWEDAIASAAIGTLSAHLLTSPRDARVQLLPWGGNHSGRRGGTTGVLAVPLLLLRWSGLWRPLGGRARRRFLGSRRTRQP